MFNQTDINQNREKIHGSMLSEKKVERFLEKLEIVYPPNQFLNYSVVSMVLFRRRNFRSFLNFYKYEE